MKKLSLILSIFIVNLLLISCSTNISDSNTSNRGLVIAVTTGSSRNLNREASPDPYSITIKVTGASYSDSQSKTVPQKGSVSFTFNAVPVGSEISVECKIQLGSTIVYSAKKNSVKVEEETTVVLDLESQLSNSFVFSDDNLNNLQKLINDCQVEAGGTPIIVFDKEISNLSTVLPYLEPNKPCILNFANMQPRAFTTSELILGQAGVHDVYLPNNCSIEIALTNNNGTLSDANSYLSSVYNMFNGRDATIKLTYTGDSTSLLTETFISNMVDNDIGSIELNGNIGVEANNNTSFASFVALLKKPCTLKQVKNTDLTNYTNIVTTIKNTSNLEVSNLYLDINTDSVTINSLNTSNPPRITNIKGLSIKGNGTNITIGTSAFSNWTGLNSNVVVISRKIKTMRQYCFKGTSVLLQQENYEDTWTKYYLYPSDVTEETGLTGFDFSADAYYAREPY